MFFFFRWQKTSFLSLQEFIALPKLPAKMRQAGQVNFPENLGHRRRAWNSCKCCNQLVVLATHEIAVRTLASRTRLEFLLFVPLRVYSWESRRCNCFRDCHFYLTLANLFDSLSIVSELPLLGYVLLVKGTSLFEFLNETLRVVFDLSICIWRFAPWP